MMILILFRSLLGYIRERRATRGSTSPYLFSLSQNARDGSYQQYP